MHIMRVKLNRSLKAPLHNGIQTRILKKKKTEAFLLKINLLIIILDNLIFWHLEVDDQFKISFQFKKLILRYLN
ncbi:hypothetical protein BpHYR1_014793 [Brachionus plicatilis]|uniref:Uncharacterized protein n=1 Tax=Brachionus plicatilis TaxID=10195 RepID=A0A3M7SSG2_BRAPC|nr:hypothetical protein BpHYR1_014793 [Brachionus plicatilis]